jgi:subtilase family serine protease
VRKKVVVFLVLVVVLISGSFIFSSRFLHSASAKSLFQPEDVGSLPPLLSVSKLQGADLSTRTLHLSIGLALRNQDQLRASLQSLYNPSSPNYHQYLTQDEFAQRFGPTAAQRQAVIDYVIRQGFAVTQVYPTLSISVGRCHKQNGSLV